MDKWFNDLSAFFHNMNVYVRMSIIAALVILGLISLKATITKHYNAKKYSLHLVPMLLTVVFIGLAIFIALI